MTPPRKKYGRPERDEAIQKHMGDTIRKYRLLAGLEQKDVAKAVGYSTSAVGNWELGFTRPDVTVVSKLCKILRMPVHELFLMDNEMILPPDEQRLVEAYRALDVLDRKEIIRHLEQLIANQEKREQYRLLERYSVLSLPTAIYPAAGVGVPMPDYSDAEKVFLHKSRNAQNSSLLLKVDGESMAPAYPNGSLVFVNTELEVGLGETGIFFVDGECYIKQRNADCLFSLNREYPDIPFTDSADIRTFGKVLGVCPKEDILTGELLDAARAAYEAWEEEHINN